MTFIIRERGGGSSSGYISSGFFGGMFTIPSLAWYSYTSDVLGLTLGRICLMWLNKMVGEHRIIIVYSLIAIRLEGLDLIIIFILLIERWTPK